MAQPDMAAGQADEARGTEFRPLAPETGVEVLGVDLARPLDEPTFRAIEAAWHARCVLLLRDQDLSEDAQVAFAQRFGPLARSVNRNAGQSERNPSAFLISNIRQDGKPIGALPDGEMLFHSDQCYVERPCAAALLYGIEIPPHGGDTIFANMYRAYETLPEELRAAVEGRRAVNVFEYAEDTDYGRPAMQIFRDLPAGVPAFAHPIVRTHPVTRRKSLYVNRGMTLCVEGMARAESDAILTAIFDHQENPRFRYTHVWRPGDLIVWDNRCTLHARTDFPSTERRMLRRVTITGERPR